MARTVELVLSRHCEQYVYLRNRLARGSHIESRRGDTPDKLVFRVAGEFLVEVSVRSRLVRCFNSDVVRRCVCSTGSLATPSGECVVGLPRHTRNTPGSSGEHDNQPNGRRVWSDGTHFHFLYHCYSCPWSRWQSDAGELAWFEEL